MEREKNYGLIELGPLDGIGRVMLKERLALTGAEISANRLPPGERTPYVHSHKRNEEIYLFTGGRGKFWLDGDVFVVSEGSAVRVAPAGRRCLKADDTEALKYFCIQVEANSLVQATREDGILADVKPEW
jgi:mannose-6-phosphate isomerase-like protein (cupin superfamily)